MNYFALVVIILFVASLIVDSQVYNRLFVRSLRKCALTYSVVSVFVLAALLLAIVFTLLRADIPQAVLGWVFCVALAVLLSKFTLGIALLLASIPKLWHGNSWRSVRRVGVVLAFAVIGYFVYSAAVTSRRIEVVDAEFASERIPAKFDGYRIVQFSDLHVGMFARSGKFVDRLVDYINAQQPDLIVFTGDIVNFRTAELHPFIKLMQRLHARDGVVAVTGNHDYGDYARWKTEQERVQSFDELMTLMTDSLGWQVLNNRSIALRRQNDSIDIVGVENWGEPPFKQYGDLDAALANVCDTTYTILLSHNPRHWDCEVAGKTNVDLTLSGHTHAMQTRFGSWSP
ncbi:MAG: metallophosphoesterase, partial [Bacteroidales bacterium]|nr:metallophosphoesterase [Bacteroidales bacterium]